MQCRGMNTSARQQGDRRVRHPDDLEERGEGMGKLMSTLVDPLAVVQLTLSAIPEWANHSAFCSISEAQPDERIDRNVYFDVPATGSGKNPFTAFMVHGGPLDFALTGIREAECL